MNILITGIHGFVGSNLLSNLKTQHKIFDHFIESQATIFIFFSSVKAVADTVTGTSLTEEQTPNPQTPYGKSKREAEKYILNNFPASDFPLPSSRFQQKNLHPPPLYDSRPGEQRKSQPFIPAGFKRNSLAIGCLRKQTIVYIGQ
jgi:nucleoside-diphosphate-sugar epimerase